VTGQPIAFPSRVTSIPDVAPEGFTLRRATVGDRPFLRCLYEDSRAEEFASIPWPDAARASFLDSQFSLQHTHYVTHFPHADFLVVEHMGRPVGRLYIDDRDAAAHVIDISVIRGEQGKGIGTTLMRACMALAASRGAGVTLQVSRYNSRAYSLYQRLGFGVVGESDTHLVMRWRQLNTA
jgi:ribosomal protein S18 acetylase RimI-like enzyme